MEQRIGAILSMAGRGGRMSYAGDQLHGRLMLPEQDLGCPVEQQHMHQCLRVSQYV